MSIANNPIVAVSEDLHPPSDGFCLQPISSVVTVGFVAEEEGLS
ncbi:hypothetical protein Q2T83_15605 [Fervidibacter sacchari]|uniref:Uncharacterized protein n=1 Tax=Candidatus Fervidibacter sacchari TaxID=1448929 RepID=A0ABT2EIZ9_9BACT|nr:hypothetical protein [Candidatus Fervidibacter sacchari]MCS3917929.1 hypothetical protein [Candidatus Fervidibacter sacchari]WKU15745.1 hypothetical protein Q2T83_15605 [Candidatus Fervidibacter sacchari]